MSKIKLFEVDKMDDGTRRLQSQLLVGKDSVDFIIDPSGILKAWGHGHNGVNFYPYDGKFEIVSNKKNMSTQSM